MSLIVLNQAFIYMMEDVLFMVTTKDSCFWQKCDKMLGTGNSNIFYLLMYTYGWFRWQSATINNLGMWLRGTLLV